MREKYWQKNKMPQKSGTFIPSIDQTQKTNPSQRKNKGGGDKKQHVSQKTTEIE